MMQNDNLKEALVQFSRQNHRPVTYGELGDLIRPLLRKRLNHNAVPTWKVLCHLTVVLEREGRLRVIRERRHFKPNQTVTYIRLMPMEVG